jgi:hypothetical protein
MQQRVLADGGVGPSVAEARAAGRPLGDLWLDAQGKARAEGPEQRRGRANLYETLHQTNPSGPYQGGSTVRRAGRGSQGAVGGCAIWDAVGGGAGGVGRAGAVRAAVQPQQPQPSAAPTRASCYASAQAAPPVPRVRLQVGDAWLEAKGRRQGPAGAPPEAAAILRAEPLPPVPPRQPDPIKHASHLVVKNYQITPKD